MSADFDPNVSQPTPATPSVEPTPAPAIQGAPTPTGTPASPAVPAQAPATGVPDGYVPSYRLRETREAVIRDAQRLIQEREAEYQRQVEEWRTKAQALAGFGPKPDPEVETVKSQFAKLYPGLAKLDDNKVEALLQLLDRSGDLEAQTDFYWRNYGMQSIGRLFEAAEADLGQPLTDDAKAALQAHFTGYLNANPRLQEVYASDPQFAVKYWKAFSANFIDPVRRISQAGAQTRAQAPIPQDNRGGVPVTTPAAKPANLEDRVGLAWETYNRTKRG